MPRDVQLQESERQPTHLILVRGADEDPEGANAQFKIAYAREPEPDDLERYCEHMEAVFSESFGRKPARVGVAVLPWVAELDEDEDDD